MILRLDHILADGDNGKYVIVGFVVLVWVIQVLAKLGKTGSANAKPLPPKPALGSPSMQQTPSLPPPPPPPKRNPKRRSRDAQPLQRAPVPSHVVLSTLAETPATEATAGGTSGTQTSIAGATSGSHNSIGQLSRDDIRSAIIFTELLDPPLSLRSST